MKLIIDHILDFNESFVSEPDINFDLIFHNIENEDKEENKKLLIYIDKVLNILFNQRSSELNCFHINFVGDYSCCVNLIGEYLILKLFYKSYLNDNFQGINLKTEDRINKIKLRLKTPYKLPPENNSSLEKKIRQENKGLSLTMDFLNTLGLNKSLVPETIINLSKKTYDALSSVFKYKQFGIPVDLVRESSSYVVINYDKTIDNIDEINIDSGPLLNNIKDVIIFGCDSKQVHRITNYRKLCELNTDGCGFNNLIIISFDKDGYRFNSYLDKFKITSSRYSNNDNNHNNIYSIFQEEVISSYLNFTSRIPEVIFYDLDITKVWNNFVELLSKYEDLYELQSIRLKNIYSLSLSMDLKNYLISKIFSSSSQRNILSSDTLDTLSMLSINNQNEIKESLNSLLEVIANSSYKEHICINIDGKGQFVLPRIIANDKIFIGKFKSALGLTSQNKIADWYSIKDIKGTLTILEYRDAGSYPFRCYPNIFEYQINSENQISCVFLKGLFSEVYLWSKYNYYNSFVDILNNDIRLNKFDWSSLKASVLATKPSFSDIDWGLESHYSYNHDFESINIIFSNNDSRSYYPSELFIVTEDDCSYEVKRIDELANVFSPESNIKVKRLEEFYDNLNLYEKFSDSTTEVSRNTIINNIRSTYDIRNDLPSHSIWKYILQRECQLYGDDSVYQDIKNKFSNNGLEIVKYNYFCDYWTNPCSNITIPREKKKFKVLCDYLNIDIAYFKSEWVSYKRRKYEATQSTRTNNQLFKLLFDENLFNKEVDYKGVLEENKELYLNKVSWDDFGVKADTNSVIAHLASLIDLLKEKLNNLSLVKSISVHE